MSFLVYSAAFDGLPAYAKDVLYRRFAEILAGQDRSAPYAQLSASDARAVVQILTDTKPEFRSYWAAASGAAASGAAMSGAATSGPAASGTAAVSIPAM